MEKTMADQVIQRQDKDGMLRRALERIIQLYTDKSHFVYELLQNAEDAGATQIKFIQYEDCLEVLHDGHPFSLDNLQGLCDIGKSDKIGDLNQIGEFGVGFKSVFGICETVRLYSHPTKEDENNGYKPFAVEIQNFTHPVTIQDGDIRYGYTTRFIFPYKVGFTFSGFESIEKLNEVLSARLQNLGITTLLFMKNLQTINYEIHRSSLKTSGSYMLEKKMINDHCALVSAIGETNVNVNSKRKDKKGKKEEQISYLIFTRPVAGIQSGRTIDIAFTVNVDESGVYTFCKPKYPYISVYFPTETESKLKFIVQGPYRTTPNRSSVPADDKDNIQLARQTSELLHDSIKELRNAGKLNLSLLNILPIDEYEFESTPLFGCMYKMTVEMMKEEKFLICKDGSYVSPENAKIARGDNFSEVFTDDLLTELLDEKKEYHWLPTVLTETNKQYKDLYSFLTDTLDIEVMRPENMSSYFNNNKNFLQKRDDEWLVRLYTMYEKVGAAFSKQRGGSNMLTAEFIKTSKGTFVSPYRKSDGNQNYRYSFVYRDYENSTYLPNVFLPSKGAAQMEDIPFVDEQIYHQCEHFFKEILSLQKPNEYEFFVRDFEKRYRTGKQISDDQHITDIKHLLKYRTNEDYKDEIDSLIRKYLVLKCNKDGESSYVSPFREKVYFPRTEDGMLIEYYFKNVLKCFYVDLEFYQLQDIGENKLSILGVLREIATGQNKTSGEYYTGNPGRKPDWNTCNGFWWRLSLYMLDDVLKYISTHPKAPDAMVKSSFIFKFLQQNESHLMGTVYIGGSTPNIYNAVSDIVTTLRHEKMTHRYYGSGWNGKWLFTESGDLVSQKEISKRDLNPQLYGDINLDSSLYEILGFVKNEVDQLEDVVKDYDCIPEEKREQYFEIEFQRRFGIPVEEAAELLEGKTRDGKRYSKALEDEFEFPSSKVKNWDFLRKHVAEVLCFASPVTYEYAVRRIRVSNPVSEVQAYLKNMYKIDGKYKFACQMCHDAFANMERCQIANNPKLELDAMNLCLCPNCAREYKKMRADSEDLKLFLDRIADLEDAEINGVDPVEVDFAGEPIWFTQSHIAEIRELMALQNKSDNYRETLPNRTNERVDEVAVTSEKGSDSMGTDVYKEYIGKRVYHKSNKAHGTVTYCDGIYIKIRFEEGKRIGQEVKLSLKACLEKGLLQLS